MMVDDQKWLSQVYLQLPQPKDKVQCQYVWIDGSLRNVRTKSKTWPNEPINVEELPVMEFCGSATDFDVGNLADYYAYPVKIYKDPFRLGSNRLIYCETRTRESLPTFANNRHRLLIGMEKLKNQVSEFSFFQPYTLLRPDGKPLSYLKPAYSPDSGSGFICGRELAESHYRVCLYSGVNIRSLEPVSNQGQWKYAVGPSSTIEVGDDIWMSRYLLTRVAEDFGIVVSFDSTYEWKCLKSLSADVEFYTDHLIQPYRHSIIDNLFSKFSINGSFLKIVTPPNKIVIKGINSETDPYSILTRLLEITSQ